MVLKFGKHKGRAINDIADIDPDYIIWLDKKKLVNIDKATLEYAKSTISFYSVLNSTYDNYGDRD